MSAFMMLALAVPALAVTALVRQEEHRIVPSTTCESQSLVLHLTMTPGAMVLVWQWKLLRHALLPLILDHNFSKKHLLVKS